MRREYISVDIKESGGRGVRDFELEKCGTRFSRVFDFWGWLKKNVAGPGAQNVRKT